MNWRILEVFTEMFWKMMESESWYGFGLTAGDSRIVCTMCSGVSELE